MSKFRNLIVFSLFFLLVILTVNGQFTGIGAGLGPSLTTPLTLNRTIDSFDFGVGANFGFAYAGIQLNVGNNYGIKVAEANLANQFLDFRNRGLTVQVGYLYKLDNSDGW